MSTPNSTVVVQQIIMPEKPDFMDKKRIAAELSISIDTIDKWVKDGFFVYDKHYFVKEKVIRYNYPAIKLLLAPRDMAG